MSEETRCAGTLVLVIRGWGDAVPLLSPGGAIPDALQKLLQSTYPGARVECPKLDMGTGSNATPQELVKQLLTEVNRWWEQGAFNELVIVAFSAGTLLARNFYSKACGAWMPGPKSAGQGAPSSRTGSVQLPLRLSEDQALGWAPLVTRMVFLAGVTRGWCTSSATPAALRFFAPILLTVLNANARRLGKGESFIQQIKRGAPFVIESRLLYQQVEQYCAEPGARFKLPHTVLLLGSRDEYVSPADALDLGLSKEFSYIEVPDSSHVDMVDVAQGPRPKASDSSREARRQRVRIRRAELIVAALTQSPGELEKIAMNRDDVDDYIDDLDRPIVRCSTPTSDTAATPGSVTIDQTAAPPTPVKIDQVVIIVHGIRDNGFWTKRMAREVKAIGRDRKLVIRAPSPSYGFFSMWDFVNFWGRLDATYWFLDKYAEIRVLYPDVPISFIGHSNGTFLAAHALRLSPMVLLDRVVFAGCVVRTDFKWSDIKGQASSVLNLIATSDLVVACLPGAFQRLGLRFFGVGGAGFDGFDDRVDRTAETGPAVRNFHYLAGGHGIGVSEAMWRPIAAYVVNGTIPNAAGDNPLYRQKRNSWQTWIGRLSWLAPILIVAVLGLIIAVMVGMLNGLALAVLAALFAILVDKIVRQL